MSFKEGVKRKERLCFVGKKKIEKCQTKLCTYSKKTSFWERREKSQEQGEIARRGLISVVNCSSNQVRVSYHFIL